SSPAPPPLGRCIRSRNDDLRPQSADHQSVCTAGVQVCVRPDALSPASRPGPRDRPLKICHACGSSHCDDAWSCADCGHRPVTIAGFEAFAPDRASENAGFRPEYFDELARFEADNFWFRARNELIVWALQRYFPAGRSFLEVGCGTGFVLSGIHAADTSL